MKTNPLPCFVLVEDDEEDRFIVREALRDSGCPYELLEFENGFQFLNFLQQKSYQETPANCSFLVILDMYLPGLNGVEVLQIMRQNAYWQHTPVIAISGRVDQNLVWRVEDLGVSAYLRKPDSIEELAHQIKVTFRPCLDEHVASLLDQKGEKTVDGGPKPQIPEIRGSNPHQINVTAGLTKASV